MTPEDRTTAKWVPTVARLHVPLHSVVNLRKIAGNLRSLANRLDFMSRSSEDAKTLLTEAWYEIRRINREMQRIRRPGRPSRNKHKMWYGPLN